MAGLACVSSRAAPREPHRVTPRAPRRSPAPASPPPALAIRVSKQHGDTEAGIEEAIAFLEVRGSLLALIHVLCGRPPRVYMLPVNRV